MRGSRSPRKAGARGLETTTDTHHRTRLNHARNRTAEVSDSLIGLLGGFLFRVHFGFCGVRLFGRFLGLALGF